MKDIPVPRADLDVFTVEGIALPVGVGASSFRNATVIEGPWGIADARVQPEGRLIDPARVAASLAEWSNHGNVDARLLSISGRPAVEIVFDDPAKLGLYYAISLPSRVTMTESFLPELRVAYAFPLHERHTRTAIRAAIGTAVQLDDATLADGHLTFGPFRLVPGMGLVDDEGIPQPLEEEEVHLSGGYFLFTGNAAGDGVPVQVELSPAQVRRPPLLERADVERTLGARYPGVAINRILESPPFRAPSGMANCRRIDVEIGWGWCAIYLWSDLLGYDWSLTYSAPSGAWRRVRNLLAQMEEAWAAPSALWRRWPWLDKRLSSGAVNISITTRASCAPPRRAIHLSLPGGR